MGGPGDEVERPARASFASRQPGPVLVLAGLLWAAAGLIGRAAPMSGPVLAAWRSVLGAVAYQVVLRTRGRGIGLADLRTAALGGLGFGASVACLFVAYKTTTLISANVIGCLQPMALGLIDHRGGRRLSAVQWAATLTAVAGTVLVVVGSSAHTGTWSLTGDLFALAGTVANVVYVLGTKRARRTMEALPYQASMLWVAALVTVPLAWISVGGPPITVARGWWSIVGLVAIGGSGHLLFSAAQRHVSVAASSAIVLVEVVAVAIGAAVVFDQPISVVQGVGMAVVAGAVGVWLARPALDLDLEAPIPTAAPGD